jgi:hypothetical protein
MEGRLYAHGTSTILVLADRSGDLDADGSDR